MRLNKYLFGQGVAGGKTLSECVVWEGMQGGAVWAGLDGEYGGRAKDMQSLSWYMEE